MFLRKVSAKVARSSRALRTGFLTTFSSLRTTAAAVKLYRKEDVGGKEHVIQAARVCDF